MDNQIPTNDVFKDLCLLLRIHQDKDYLIALFAKAGWQVSKAKLKAWTVRAGGYHRDYRPMPEAALRAFIAELKKEQLVECSDDV